MSPSGDIEHRQVFVQVGSIPSPETDPWVLPDRHGGGDGAVVVTRLLELRPGWARTGCKEGPESSPGPSLVFHDWDTELTWSRVGTCTRSRFFGVRDECLSLRWFCKTSHPRRA